MLWIFRGRGLAKQARVYAQIDVGFRNKMGEFRDKGSFTPLALWLYISLHSDEGGWSWPSRSKMMSDLGVTTEATITKALAHLRQVRVDGKPVLAHFRVRDPETNQWGRSAYLVFPEAEGVGPAPFENLVQYDPSNPDPVVGVPPVGEPLVAEPLLKEEPVVKKNQDRAQGRNWNEKRAFLEEHFSDITKLPMPLRDTARERKSAGVLWWTPLGQILKSCNDDEELAAQVISAVVDEMDRDCLTISSPKSILQKVSANIAKVKRGQKVPQYSVTHL